MAQFPVFARFVFAKKESNLMAVLFGGKRGQKKGSF